MNVQCQNLVMLPFSADEPCLFSTADGLHNVCHQSLEGTELLRPVVIYGVPSAGKSYFKSVLEEHHIGVLDTDDLILPEVARLARRVTHVIHDDLTNAQGRAWRAIADHALTCDSDLSLFDLAWGECGICRTARELKAEARSRVDRVLAKNATYNGVSVVLTNFTNLEFYDFGFARRESAVERYIHLYPGISEEKLASWYRESQATAARAGVSFVLADDEYILTV